MEKRSINDGGRGLKEGGRFLAELKCWKNTEWKDVVPQLEPQWLAGRLFSGLSNNEELKNVTGQPKKSGFLVKI